MTPTIPVEVFNRAPYEGILQVIFDFQPLIVGIAAAAIAALTIFAIYAPVRENRKRIAKLEKRRRRVGCYELSKELLLVGKRARQGQGTIKVQKATNKDVTDGTRERISIPIPRLITDADFMALLPEETVMSLNDLKAHLADHAFDVMRTGGAFGDDNFGRQMSDRLGAINTQASKIAQELIGISKRQD